MEHIEKVFICFSLFFIMEKNNEGEKNSAEELAKKYGIDLEALKKEQVKLSKALLVKDSIDFSNVRLIAGIDSVFFGNKIISAISVITSEGYDERGEDFEVLENDYYSDKVKFPYIPGFRAYRELPSIMNVLSKMDEKPDLIFVKGHGISHERLGLASHLSILTGIPTIGVSESILDGEVKGDDVILNGKIVGKVFVSKRGSKPLYISPGNLISVKTALDMTKKFMKEPHKLPEPLHLAHRFSKKVMNELRGDNKDKEIAD